LLKNCFSKYYSIFRNAAAGAAAGAWGPILVTLCILGILAAAAIVIVLSLIPVYLPTKTVPRRTNGKLMSCFICLNDFIIYLEDRIDSDAIICSYQLERNSLLLQI